MPGGPALPAGPLLRRGRPGPGGHHVLRPAALRGQWQQHQLARQLLRALSATPDGWLALQPLHFSSVRCGIGLVALGGGVVCRHASLSLQAFGGEHVWRQPENTDTLVSRKTLIRFVQKPWKASDMRGEHCRPRGLLRLGCGLPAGTLIPAKYKRGAMLRWLLWE